MGKRGKKSTGGDDAVITTQSFKGKQEDPEKLMLKLSKLPKNQLPGNGLFVVAWEVGKEDSAVYKGKRKVCLKCPDCDETFSISNPSVAVQRHSVCPKRKSILKVDAVINQDDEYDAGEDGDPTCITTPLHAVGNKRPGTSTSPAKRQRQSDIKEYFPQLTDAVKEQIITCLAMFFYTSDTPFYRFNNKHLKEAMKKLGIDLPTEKTLRTSLLNKCFAAVKGRVEKQLTDRLVSACRLLMRPC